MILISGMVLIALLAFPSQCTLSARTALSVWGLDIVPSLFPYMVFCRMLSQNLLRRRIPASPMILILGMAGGSPCGAAVIRSCRNRIKENTMVLLAVLTGTISPMFFLSTVQQWIRSKRICVLLLCSQYIGTVFSCICVHLLFRRKTSEMWHASAQEVSGAQPENPITESIQSILHVGGCIVVFSVLGSLTAFIPGIDQYVSAMIHCFLEVSGGMNALSQLPLPLITQTLLFAFFAGFTGLSIILQNYAMLSSLGISFPKLVMASFLRAVGSVISMAILLYFNMN